MRNRNVAQILRWAATASPNAVAIVEPDREATYAGLLRRAVAYATAYAGMGITPDEPVAIFLERGIDAAAAYFGAAFVGAITVFVNESLRPRQVEHILSHVGARLLVSTAFQLRRQPRPLESGVPFLDARDVEDVDTPSAQTVHRDSDDVAQVIYTSGSSGAPKGVMVTHGNIHAATESVSAYLGLTHNDRIASLLPFSFVYGMSQLMCSIRKQATLVVERSPLPASIVATLQHQRATVLAAVPTLWRQLLGVPAFREPIASLRVLTNAGGRLNGDAVHRIRSAQPQADLFLMYGCTETMRSTYLPPAEVDAHPDSIGRAIPGAAVDVVRSDGTEAADGEVGEIVHTGPTVTRGYWNDADRTAAVYRPHPWRRNAGTAVFTGDLARRDNDGRLHVVGRNDRIIKTMGFRVGPDEVADGLYESGQVDEALVFGEDDAASGQRIVACVVLSPHGTLDALRAWCLRELPRHLRPGRYDVRERLPVLANGKPDLVALTAGVRATTS